VEPGQGEKRDRGTARQRGTIVLCSAVGLIVGGVVGYAAPHPQPAEPIVVATPPGTATPSPAATPATLHVHVAGEVGRPGVYTLPQGSMVQNAVDLAGGPGAAADLDSINLAQELHDHQQVYVPCEGEAIPLAGREDAGVKALVDINTAGSEALETLPRVGPATAQRIIDYRAENGRFETIEDIQDVPGIGPATYDGLKDLITIGP